MRQHLLDAALTVIARDGAAALTVRQVALEAGCSTTGIYTYFQGKLGLVDAIFVDGFESFDRTLVPYYEADDLLASARAYREWALANPVHYLIMFGRAVPDFRPGPASQTRARDSFAALERVMARLGVVEPRVAAFHLYACAHGHVMLELVGLGPVEEGLSGALYENGIGRVVADLLSSRPPEAAGGR